MFLIFFKILFGVFRLGFITSFLSSSVIDALIAASAIFVVTSLIPGCLGISVDKAEGIGLVVKVIALTNYRDNKNYYNK